MAAIKGEEVNGFRNCETWKVKIWLTGEQESYERWKNEARRLWDEAACDSAVIAGRLSQEEKTELDLCSRLEGALREAATEVKEAMFADLLLGVLGSVAWHEVAEHFLADLPEFNSKKQR